MNERIRQLAVEAGFYANPDVEKFEKFAELIVAECVQAYEVEVDTWKRMDPFQGSIKRQGSKAIKEHFGVEE